MEEAQVLIDAMDDVEKREREEITGGNPKIKRYSPTTYLKFIILSAFGIFVFFINFPLPAYSVEIGSYSFSVAANTTILCNHFVSLIKAALWTGSFKAMPYVVYLIGIYGLVDLYVRRKKHFGTSVAFTFSVFRVIGFILLTFIVFDFGPAFLTLPLDSIGGNAIGKFVLNNILISITISIPVAAFFLPFLLDYGLVDFVGVLVRPFMRPVFRLPGRAAVIMVSAFLGNFSVGHIACNDQYKTGRMTEREAVVISTSLSTVSVAFLMVLANNTHIMEFWNAYFWTAFLITLLITIVGVRVFPLHKVRDDYYGNAVGTPETNYKKHLAKNAYIEAMEIAEHAESPFSRIGYILKETINVLGAIALGSCMFSCVGVLLFNYTPIFEWIGYIFYPFMRIAIPAHEAITTSTGAAISLLEVTIPSLLVAAGEWTLRARYMMAVIPVTSIVFIASFVPCLLGTDIPVKVSHLFVIWIERMILSVVFTALFALLLFPAGAV